MQPGCTAVPQRVHRSNSKPGWGWAVAGIACAAAVLSALYGAGPGLAALALLSWLGLPGVLFAFRRRGDTTALAGGLVSGWAATLVVTALAGTLLGRFHWTWILAVPGVLSLLVARCVPSERDDSSQSVPPGPQFWLAISMLVGLVLAWPALSHVGSITDSGVNFRPFFNADFFKHVGVAQGFLLGDFPPRDLFGDGGSVQYYWLQHVLPATLLSLLPGDPDPFAVLGAITGWQTVTLGALLYLWALRYCGNGGVACLLVLAATASLSLDGLASFVASGKWIEPAQNFNMEPMDLTTSLFLTSDRIHASTLYRLNLYVPQHQLCAVFIVAYFLSLRGGTSMAGRQWDRAALLAAMPAASLLMGLPALGIVTLVLAANWLMDRKLPWVEAGGAVLGLALPLATGMVSLGSSVVRLATATIPIVSEPVWMRLLWLPAQLVTSFGFMLVLAASGLVFTWRERRSMSPLAMAPAVGMALCVVGYAATIILLPPTFLLIDAQLKLSFVLGLMLVPLAALAVSKGWLLSHRGWRIGLGVLVLLGLASPIHDARWHSCETDRCRTTAWQSTTIPAADWEALQWIRRNTPSTAVFQQSPEPDFLAGGRDVWIPVFAGRRIHASRRGSHVGPTEIEEAERLFDPLAEQRPSAHARALGVEYLYLSRALQGKSFPELTSRFAADRGLTRVFVSADVSIWQVMNRT